MNRSKRIRKGKRMGLVLLIISSTFLVISIRAEEEYHVIMTLQAPEPTYYGAYGYETALFKDGIVIGEWTGDVGDISSAGRAYIYDTDWGLTSILQVPMPKETENFGRDIDVLNDIIVVGCGSANIGELEEAGKVYVFDTDGSLLTSIQSPDPKAKGDFGNEVSIYSDGILVAEIGGMEHGFIHPGCVYEYNHEGVFIRNVTSPAMKPEGCFGQSLVANEEFILVGEPGNLGGNFPIDHPSIYVYDYGWNLITTIQPPDLQERTYFGFSTSMNDDYFVIGERWATVDDHEKAGRAHIYDTNWNHVATLQSPTPEDNGEFGLDVVIGGDIVVVGERRGDVESMNEGKAYVFDLEGNLISTLISPAPFPGNQFGYSVETDGDIIVVCEADVEAGGESKAGKVHIFSLGAPSVKTSVETTAETTETTSEPDENKSNGIPGFPIESVLASVIIALLVLWITKIKR
jgi:hypothetical protein